jgi:hypothetical protein
MLMCILETTRSVFRTRIDGQASKQPMLSSGVGQAFRSSSPVAEMVVERTCMRTNRKWFTPWIRPYQASRVSIKQAFAAELRRWTLPRTLRGGNGVMIPRERATCQPNKTPAAYERQGGELLTSASRTAEATTSHGYGRVEFLTNSPTLAHEDHS